MKRYQAVAAAAIVAALVFPAVAEEPKSASASSDAQQVEHGKQLYAGHCSHCHGFNMVNPGTVAYDLRQFPHDQKERFVNSVTHGKNDRMPPWGDLLSAEEIDALWAYIRTGGNS